MAFPINSDYDYFKQLGINPLTGTEKTDGQYQTDDANAPSVFLSDDALAGNSEVDIDSVEDEYAQAAEAVSGTNGTTATSGATSEEIQEEIEKLEEEKAENIEKMEKIEDHIEELAESAKENIEKAAAAQNEAVKEHEEEVDKALDEQLNAYIEANKEGGEGMTRDELQENIKGALPNIPEVGDAVAALTAASKEVSEIDSCLGELNKLISDTQLIDEEIKAKEGEYEAAVQAEEAAKCCDPIGFTTGEGEDQAQYDFIVDDGSFDSTSDFLGADGQWSEMTALDTDGDNIVSAAELQAGNIKAVKTNADGSQEIVDLAEEFGEDFSIDLSSYEEGGSHSAINTEADENGNGVNDQTLLGTFSLNINGEKVNGYNTLDDSEWLSENYGIANGTETDSEAIEYSEELQPHVNFFNEYTELSEQLKTEIQEGYENIGISQEQMASIDEIAQKEGDEDAKNFFASLNLNEDDMNEEKPVAGTEVNAEDPEKQEEELIIEEQLAA